MRYVCFRLIRVSAADQFFYIITKTMSSNASLLVLFISLLFSAVEVSHLRTLKCLLDQSLTLLIDINSIVDLSVNILTKIVWLSLGISYRNFQCN